ncbi:MAG: CotH kinase family protein, partial [Patescibacteria group bacterium]
MTKSKLFSLIQRKLNSRVLTRRLVLAAAILAGFFIFSGCLFWYEYTGRFENFINTHPNFKFAERLPKILDIYYLPLSLHPSSLPEYRLEIDKKYLADLEKALPTGAGVCCNCLPTVAQNDVKGKFYSQGEEFNVKTRVRGSCSNHWSSLKKSWRVTFSKGTYFNGLSQVDFVIPSDREYIMEYLNNYRAKKLGLVVPEMKLVQLVINGKYFGPYLQQEIVSSDVLEKNRQAPDVNIYNEDRITDRLFLDITEWKKLNSDKISGINNYAELNLLLDLINKSSDEEFFAKISQIVDMDNLYKWSVSSMLAGNYHQDFAHNMKIYFDNSLGKFKFIPDDVGFSDSPTVDIVYNPLMTRIVKNPIFVYERNKILWDYVKNNDNLDDDLKFFDNAYQQIRWAEYKDHKTVYSSIYFDKKLKLRRQHLVDLYQQAQETLNQGEVSVKIDYSQNQPKSAAALYPIVRVEFSVDSFSGAKLKNIHLVTKPKTSVNGKLSLYYDSNNNGIFDIEDTAVGKFEVKNDELVASAVDGLILAERNISENIDYNSEDFDAGIGPLMKPIRLKVTSRSYFIVADQPQSTAALDLLSKVKFDIENAATGKPINYNSVDIDETTFSYLNDVLVSVDEFVRRHPEFQRQGNVLKLPAGSHSFQGKVIIPSQAEKLVIEPGATLNMAPGASIISYAPVMAKGAKDLPIVIQRSQPDKPWGVFAVVGQREKLNEFDFLKISGGSPDYVNGIFFSGQLAIYWSNVKISNSEFSQSSGDDNLNVKYGLAEIRDNYFHNSGFDAIDFDYVLAGSVVANNTFFRNGNDGIDISGSPVQILNNKII